MSDHQKVFVIELLSMRSNALPTFNLQINPCRKPVEHRQQGDQIGRIFAYSAIVFVGQFC
jgi:hypothetical protein